LPCAQPHRLARLHHSHLLGIKLERHDNGVSLPAPVAASSSANAILSSVIAVVLGWVQRRNSTLADRPDDHLDRLPGGAPRQTRGGSLGAPPPTANFHHLRGR
jgi:hypothetical protein